MGALGIQQNHLSEELSRALFFLKTTAATSKTKREGGINVHKTKTEAPPMLLEWSALEFLLLIKRRNEGESPTGGGEQ